MNPKSELRVAVEVLLAIGLLFCVYTAINEHDARIRAEDGAKYQQQLVQQSQAASAELAKERDANQQALQQATSALEKQRQQAVTPDQMAGLIDKFTNLKPQIVTIPATPTQPAQQVAEIPVSELSTATDLVTACQQCKLDLTAAQSNVTSLQKQVSNDADALKAMQAERDDYKAALKGGTFFQRLKRNAREVLIGIGIGVAVGEISAHRGF